MNVAVAAAQADIEHGAEVLDVAAKRRVFIDALMKLGKKKRRTLVNVEGTELRILERMSTKDTILEEGIKALLARGVPIKSTVGAVMRHLNLSQEQMNDFTCECRYKDRVSGYDAATGLIWAIDARYQH